MNILLINHYAGSTEMGMEFRPYYMAREWTKLGHKVDIIAGDYSHLRKMNPTVKYDFQTEDIDGITYHWIKRELIRETVLNVQLQCFGLSGNYGGMHRK